MSSTTFRLYASLIRGMNNLAGGMSFVLVRFINMLFICAWLGCMYFILAGAGVAAGMVWGRWGVGGRNILAGGMSLCWCMCSGVTASLVG